MNQTINVESRGDSPLKSTSLPALIAGTTVNCEGQEMPGKNRPALGNMQIIKIQKEITIGGTLLLYDQKRRHKKIVFPTSDDGRKMLVWLAARPGMKAWKMFAYARWDYGKAHWLLGLPAPDQDW